MFLHLISAKVILPSQYQYLISNTAVADNTKKGGRDPLQPNRHKNLHWRLYYKGAITRKVGITVAEVLTSANTFSGLHLICDMFHKKLFKVVIYIFFCSRGESPRGTHWSDLMFFPL